LGDDDHTQYYNVTRLNTYVSASLTTAEIDEETNLYYTNTRVQTYIDSIGVASGSTESASYASNADLLDNQNGTYYLDWDNFTNVPINIFSGSHGDLIGLGDDDHTQYYNVTRLNTYVSSSLTTAEIDEQTNLYYTDVRVDSYLDSKSVLSGSMIINSSSYASNADLLDNQNGTYYLDWDNFTSIPSGIVSGSHGDLTGLGDDDHTQYYNVTRLNTYVSSSLTTANITEETNLYYTDTRVDLYLDLKSVLSSSFQLNTYVSSSLTTAEIDEQTNLFYTDVRVDFYLDSKNVLSSSFQLNTYVSASLTTAEIDEETNLYYTDTRVSGSMGISSASYAEYVEFSNVGNKPTLVSGSSQIDHGGIVGLSDDDHTQYYNVTRLNTYISASLTTAEIDEQTNLYYTDVRVDSYLDSKSVLSGSMSSSFAESASYTLNADLLDNQTGTYYLNYNNFTNLPTLVSGSSQIDHGNVQGLSDDDHTQYYNVTRLNSYISASLTTSEIDEQTNLYYTDVRVDAYMDSVGVLSGSMIIDSASYVTDPYVAYINKSNTFSENQIISGSESITDNLYVDIINEQQTDSGVTVDGVVLHNSEMSIDYLGNPTQDNTISLAAHTLTWQFTNPFGGVLYNWQGAASGHLFELRQETGNPSPGTHLLHLDATHPNVVNLHLVQGDPGSRVFYTSVDGDTAGVARLQISASGRLDWGDGTNAVDTSIYRSVTGDLTFSDSIIGTYTLTDLVTSSSYASTSSYVTDPLVAYQNQTNYFTGSQYVQGDVSASRSITANTFTASAYAGILYDDTTPLYTFESDLDTGIGHGGINQVSIIAGGEEVLGLGWTGTERYYQFAQMQDNSTPHRFMMVDTSGYATASIPITGLVTGSGGVDHGNIQGLLDDDHTQYYNSTRLNTYISASAVPSASYSYNADLLDNYDSTAFPRKSEDATITGIWSFSGNQLNFVGYPSQSGDAATKLYVDNLVSETSGGDMLKSVYDPSDSGVVTSASYSITSSFSSDSNLLDSQTGTYYLDYDNFSNIPSGIVSGSSQIIHQLTTNYSSSEHYIQTNITQLGTVTSGDVSAILPSGTVSGSSQISYDGISDIPSGIISSSFQLNTYISASLTTAEIDEETNLFYTDVRVDTYMDSVGVISGSMITTTSSYTLDVDWANTNSPSDIFLTGSHSTTDITEGTNLFYTDTKVLTYINSQNVLSGSITWTKTGTTIHPYGLTDNISIAAYTDVLIEDEESYMVIRGASTSAYPAGILLGSVNVNGTNSVWGLNHSNDDEGGVFSITHVNHVIDTESPGPPYFIIDPSGNVGIGPSITTSSFNDSLLTVKNNSTSDGTYLLQIKDDDEQLMFTVDDYGNVSIAGNLIAEQYIISSSVTYMTQSFSSGSTIFGDTLDDTHWFTGSVSITGSLIVNGTDVLSTSGLWSDEGSYVELTSTKEISIDGYQIINLGYPSASNDAASKLYVDSLVSAASGGDMLKTVYDSNNDGTVNSADSASFALDVDRSLLMDSASYALSTEPDPFTAYVNVTNYFTGSQSISGSLEITGSGHQFIVPYNDDNSPSIAFTDLDTGFYGGSSLIGAAISGTPKFSMTDTRMTSLNELQITVGGYDKLFVEESGTSINKTNATAPLDVNGDVKISGSIIFQGEESVTPTEGVLMYSSSGDWFLGIP